MATPLPSSVVSLSGKGSSLTPVAVYSVAGGLSGVRIDSSALEKLAQSKSSSPPPPISDATQNPRFLTLEESRAALAVLLNKLLVADASMRPPLPSLIVETLSLPSGHETLDFGSPLGFLESICRLNGRKVLEIKVSGDEIGVFEASAAAPTAICAILDCCSSAMVRVSDAVAALSCEAARADVGAFDLPVSGDGFSIKDETCNIRRRQERLPGKKRREGAEVGPGVEEMEQYRSLLRNVEIRPACGLGHRGGRRQETLGQKGGKVVKRVECCCKV